VNLTTVSDLEKTSSLLRSAELERRPFTQSRYAEVLGIAAPQLARRLDMRRIWVKDESRNPTWSFKDRAASLAASHALRLGQRGLVVASTGNAAAATAAYASRAGLPALVILAKDPPVQPVMEAFVRAYGGQVVAAPTKADRWALMRHAVDELGFFPNSNFADPPLGNTPWAVDGYRALGFELWEQLGRRAPGTIVFPVGHGDALYGVYKAFRDLSEFGLSAMPAFGAAEIFGSLARAFQDELDAPPAVPVDRDTAAYSIATSQSTYQALDALRRSNGWAEQVADEAVLAAQRLLAETEGIFAETASAAALAAVRQRLDRGLLAPDEEIVIVSTSAGVKAVGVMRFEDEIPLIVEHEQLAALASRARNGERARSRRTNR
jgi:threonine synthase